MQKEFVERMIHSRHVLSSSSAHQGHAAGARAARDIGDSFYKQQASRQAGGQAGGQAGVQRSSWAHLPFHCKPLAGEGQRALLSRQPRPASSLLPAASSLPSICASARLPLCLALLLVVHTVLDALVGHLHAPHRQHSVHATPHGHAELGQQLVHPVHNR